MNRSNTTLIGYAIIGLLSAAAVLPVFGLVAWIIIKGIGRIDIQFLTEISPNMESGGIASPIVGTITLTLMTLVFAIPIGIAVALYLSEYAKPGKKTDLIEASIVNLAGVPSIVYGLFGVALFVYLLEFGASILAGALTMATLVLPLVISVTYQSLRSVPTYLREASLALGASRLQTIFKVVFPTALPGILTGIILATARIAGETAPVLFTAAAYYLPSLPESLLDKTMLLSYHLFAISTQVTGVSEEQKYGVTFVLIALVLGLNLLSILVRNRLKRKLANIN